MVVQSFEAVNINFEFKIAIGKFKNFVEKSEYWKKSTVLLLAENSCPKTVAHTLNRQRDPEDSEQFPNPTETFNAFRWSQSGKKIAIHPLFVRLCEASLLSVYGLLKFMM